MKSNCFFIAALLGVTACSGGERNPEAEGGKEELKPSRFTICSELENGYERYDFAMMTQELAEQPMLAEAAGVDRVASCDDARLVAEARETLDPALIGDEPSVLEPAVNYPVEPPPSTSVNGIWAGDASGDQRWLRVVFPKTLGESGDGATADNQVSCSAVPISPRHILTAAHCIPDGVSGWWRVRVQRATSSGADVGDAIQVGNYRVYIYQHEDWSGETDAGDDVALLSMERQCVTNDERDAIDLCSGPYYERNYDNNRVWLGNLALEVTMDIYGFGSRSRYSQTAAKLHTGQDGARITVDWTGSRHFLTDDETLAIICSGDSGGPAVLHQDVAAQVAGLASNHYLWPNQFCTRDEGISEYRKQRWHRLSATFANWIEPKLESNVNFTCPEDSGTCCMRFETQLAYTSYANHSYARCW